MTGRRGNFICVTLIIVGAFVCPTTNGTLKIDEYKQAPEKKWSKMNNKKTILSEQQQEKRRSKTFTKTITAIGLKSVKRNVG